ncbi:uncharacterized protein MELLADRAFT_43016 [Melampsora larici-populina 98AG31]|uniref:Eukaryotic translation initiation factor 3 subunit F n=1 Tax=Melampsora larici-populina (strain 98AG31 / pathotype 3-4-7) TaxID=747676 RepID=F4RI10_MELLP|nr:uncharacterized protein MELLADRAFT_43016 [Melampsora larici-populina 98AG31]EGG07914.1 hypothetical protein MELLADRAFT_43016 [Melampsora larici-populina 98AG31]
MKIPQPLSLPRLQSNLHSITNVNIQPLPLASILDHHLRRPDHQDRVFGTLLGLRNIETGEVEVRSSFGVPYAANGRDVAVDSDHHRTLLELHHRVSPKEVVVGWYATSPVLNSFSSLIQDFYNSESIPLPAIHLTLDPVTLTFKTYISSPIGLSTLQTLNLLFKPVPSSLSIPTAERTALELITQPIFQEKLPKLELESTAQSIMNRLKEPIQTDLPMVHLKNLLIRLKEMLLEVNEYVEKVNSNQCEPNHQLGQFLLNTLNSISINQTLSFEDSFQSHLADVLMVSYVSTLVREQVEISSRLNLLVSQ